MTADTIRMVGTYVIALLVLIGGFLLLLMPTQVPSEQIVPFVTGMFGAVIGWAFNKESTTGGQRAAERAVALGATTATPTNGK
ncbi:MAG TPA: hypothetical protein VFJ93_07810 [Gaiellaceae bacterium]|nr:hypothetical protein [Gaiellaceae bacterium]